jgi:L-threonylcarbamoyladenylate synthase
MLTTLLTVSPSTPDAALLHRAAEALREGQTVAFPTETVYGLGANALEDAAVAKIFAAKGRPQFNPLIVHAYSFEALREHVVVSPLAEDLAAHFMPGALTLILQRQKTSKLSWLVSAGLESVAVRVPSHPVAQALLREAAVPVAAPSANTSGSVSATTPLHVMESLGGKIDLVLGAGRCPIGVESTILDLTRERPTLLRPGGVTRESLEAILGPIAVLDVATNTPNAPGQLESHYAPNARVRLEAQNAKPDEAFLTFGPEFGVTGGKRRLNLSSRGDLGEAAGNLFAMLRELDAADVQAIAVMPIPETGLGAAINDRLRRAAAPRGIGSSL